MSDSEKEYWDEAAKEFDTVYREEKDALRRAVDKVFRKGTAERFQLTLQECKNVNGRRILDIGCGTGRMTVQLAKRGAQVVGIDFSQKMIDMAKLLVEKEGLQDRCAFLRDDFSKHLFKEKFDISLALGAFDSTKDPAFHLKKMRSLTTEKCIMSFPSKFAFGVPLRFIWLRSRNCPIYFYTKKELKRLLSPHFSRYRIKNISARYFCVASVKNRNTP